MTAVTYVKVIESLYCKGEISKSMATVSRKRFKSKVYINENVAPKTITKLLRNNVRRGWILLQCYTKFWAFITLTTWPRLLHQPKSHIIIINLDLMLKTTTTTKITTTKITTARTTTTTSTTTIPSTS